MIKELKPKVWIIENPIGGFRKMNYINDFLEEVKGVRYSITYCAYGDTRRKPTDIFTNMNDLIFDNRNKTARNYWKLLLRQIYHQ